MLYLNGVYDANGFFWPVKPIPDDVLGDLCQPGILLHGSQWYLVKPPGDVPIPLDPSRSYLFDIIMHFIHSFRMPLFFMLAGFFTSLLVGKRDFKRHLYQPDASHSDSAAARRHHDSAADDGDDAVVHDQREVRY